MTDGAWLTTQDIADARHVNVKTIYRYTDESRRRIRRGMPLRPMDIPVPRDEDKILVNGRWESRWPDGAEIREWIARTQPTERTEP